MSVRQGNEIGDFLLETRAPWNAAWDGSPVVASPGGESVKHLPGGLRITVLSPRPSELERLTKHWQDQLKHAGRKRAKGQESDDEEKEKPAAQPAGPLLVFAARDKLWGNLFARNMKQSQSGVMWRFLQVQATNPLDIDEQARFDRVISSGGQVLLLISAHMLASRTFTQQLLPLLEDSSESDRRFVSWALLEPCEWRRLPLAQVQAAHDVRKPLSKVRAAERDLVVRGIIEAVENAAQPGLSAASPAAKTKSSMNIEALAKAAFAEDAGITNAASIAFLAEFNDKSLLIGGDARSDVLCDSIRSLLSIRQRQRLRVDAFVIPHGGSSRNLSRELLELLECDKYLVSTNGAVFQHPSRETIARIITYGRSSPDGSLTLVFNYRSQFTEVWADPELQQRYRYTTFYPDQPDAGINVKI